MSNADALVALRRLLVGDMVCSCEWGDWWALHLGNERTSPGGEVSYLVVHAQELRSRDDERVSRALSEGGIAPRAVDPGIVASAVAYARIFREPIRTVDLLPDCSLVLGFEGGGDLVLPTAVPIVDWYWSLTLRGGAPYGEDLVAAFDRAAVFMDPELVEALGDRRA